MPRMGCVSHDPRVSGHVCPKPQEVERQLTLLICQTPIAPAMATTAVAPNRAG
jgi:hypothetical protein